MHRTRMFVIVALLGPIFAAVGASQEPAPKDHARLRSFLSSHCVECHGQDVKKAGLRLDDLPFDLAQPKNAGTWLRVFDRIANGEMPPAEQPRPTKNETDATTHWLNRQLHAHSLQRQAQQGRVVLRRLNNTEYENTLRDLLGVNVSVKAMLPKDNESAGFDNISAALETSAGHLLAYQEAAEKAIRAAIPVAPLTPIDAKRSGKEIVQKDGNIRELVGKSISFRGDSAVVHARLPDHYTGLSTPLTPQKGKYRIRVSAYAINSNGRPLTMAIMGRPVRDRAGQDLRTLHDVPENKSTLFEVEFEMNRECHAWAAPWSIPDRYELFLQKVKDLEKHTGPAIVIEGISMEGPIGDWPPESYRALFGDVPLKARSVAVVEAAGRKAPAPPASRGESFWENYDPLVPASTKPREDAERILRKFVPRALRRPTSEELADRYVKLVHGRLDDKYSFHDAMTFGLKALLTSADFLYLHEPGDAPLTKAGDFSSTRLDDFAIASRLSYFLWSSMPDEELKRAARAGELSQPDRLRAQVERMLNHPRAGRFIDNFVGQWLDLRKINDTTPDPKLYPEFDLYLQWSMEQETERFFAEVLKHDRSLLEFVDSDWSVLNDRLADHYGIAGVTGHAPRKVKLPEGSHRGGVMTQASVLKVTADGTRTSPVLRGKWVLERIVGKPPSPPPPDIPLFEPDIRGATTIRQQLEKHRNVPACATCHNHIDPPGFALESFDAIGGRRSFYRSPERTKGGYIPGKRYFKGPDVELGGTTPDGATFKTIGDYRKILLADKKQIARSLVRKMITYATGADLQFADREVVEDIVARLERKNFGFRELIHEVTQSRVFLKK